MNKKTKQEQEEWEIRFDKKWGKELVIDHLNGVKTHFEADPRSPVFIQLKDFIRKELKKARLEMLDILEDRLLALALNSEGWNVRQDMAWREVLHEIDQLKLELEKDEEE